HGCSSSPPSTSAVPAAGPLCPPASWSPRLFGKIWVPLLCKPSFPAPALQGKPVHSFYLERETPRCPRQVWRSATLCALNGKSVLVYFTVNSLDLQPFFYKLPSFPPARA